MAKNILQDIVPPEKRSIRNIPIPKRRMSESPMRRPAPMPQEAPEAVYEEEHIREEEYAPKQQNDLPKIYPYGRRSKVANFFSRKAIWVACGVALLIVLFALSSLFTGTTLNIKPKVETVSVEGQTLSAYQGDSGTGVPYEVVKITKDLGKSVPASGEEHVDRKASGQIVIYNNFDSNSQRLIKNTRFETPEGLIYRINDSVVVPGRTTSGGQTTPGSIEATVYADEAGDKYNIGLKDFTIPGFENDAGRFKNIYARSKTEMTGGFVGDVKKVSDSDLKQAQDSINSDLKTALLADVKSQVPGDFTMYQDGAFVTYDSLPQSDAKTDSVTVNQRGNMTAIIFKNSSLSKYLADTFSTSDSSSTVMASNLPDLGFQMIDKDSFNPDSGKPFQFVLTGKVNLVSQFNQDALVTDLLGKPKSALNSVLQDYPAIESATASIKPFWKRSFPTNAKDFKIVISS